MADYTQLLENINIAIKSEVGKILLPFFETMQRDKENMKLIENVLKQMPEFKRLEAENQELKQRLMVPAPALAPAAPAPVPVPVPAALVPAVIKLEVSEKIKENDAVVLEDEIYAEANLLNRHENTIQNEEEAEAEAEASEAEASEAEETEAEASESEEEEEEETEAEASESEEEEEETEAESSESEASEAEEEEGVEGGLPLGVEGGLPLGVEGGLPLALEEEDEVSIIEIKGHGKYFVTNETNGDIYAIAEDEEVGDQVGKFVNKIPTFF